MTEKHRGKLFAKQARVLLSAYPYSVKEQEDGCRFKASPGYIAGLYPQKEREGKKDRENFLLEFKCPAHRERVQENGCLLDF